MEEIGTENFHFISFHSLNHFPIILTALFRNTNSMFSMETFPKQKVFKISEVIKHTHTQTAVTILL